MPVVDPEVDPKFVDYQGQLTKALENEQVATSSGDGRYWVNKLEDTIHYRCVGRLIGRINAGYISSATAFAVGPRMIMTAGHCVHTGPGGKPITNLQFEPGYPTLGRLIPVQRVVASKAWVQGGAYSQDYAFGITDEVIHPDLWYGIRTGLKDPPGWTIYGYPSRPPFDGELPYGDGGASTIKPWRATGPGPSELRFNVQACDKIDLTPGSSGGPWLGGSQGGSILSRARLPDHPNRSIEAAGLQSHSFNKHPGCVGSPYFNQDLINLFRKAQTLVG